MPMQMVQHEIPVAKVDPRNTFSARRKPSASTMPSARCSASPKKPSRKKRRGGNGRAPPSPRPIASHSGHGRREITTFRIRVCTSTLSTRVSPNSRAWRFGGTFSQSSSTSIRVRWELDHLIKVRSLLMHRAYAAVARYRRLRVAVPRADSPAPRQPAKGAGTLPGISCCCTH